MIRFNRRDFLRTSLFGGVAAATLPSYAMNVLAEQTKVSVDTTSRVSLVTGADRADMAFRALQPFSKEIAQAIGNKRILIKPNLVSTVIQLSATHKETIEGILEFLKSIKKLDDVIICESAADGPAMGAYDNYGFIPVASKYNVKLFDLDEGPTQMLYMVNELSFHPMPCRMSSMLMDRNNFVISVARMKAHDRILCTLSLKNVVVGAPIKDPGFGSGRNRVAGTVNHKPAVHGNGFRAINFNLFNTAYHIRPDLAFIDGYDGMEGNGPTGGTPVEHRVCVAGLDWLAVDRVGVELMGMDPANLGYLNFCADAGMGEYDLSKIEVVGEKVTDHIRKYAMNRNFDLQMTWKIPLRDRPEPFMPPREAPPQI